MHTYVHTGVKTHVHTVTGTYTAYIHTNTYTRHTHARTHIDIHTLCMDKKKLN